jgi:hypothetical protein
VVLQPDLKQLLRYILFSHPSITHNIP